MVHVNQTPLVSVLMPTFRQAAFIRRALESVLAQSLWDWELIIIDDGSPDETERLVSPFLDDSRLMYQKLDCNRGLGAALNVGLDQASGDLVAYLPSDDVFYADHLASLVSAFAGNPPAALAYSGARHYYNRTAHGQIDGEPLQLVQVVHRRSPARWMERDELVTDDLDRMYWSKLCT